MAVRLKAREDVEKTEKSRMEFVQYMNSHIKLGKKSDHPTAHRLGGGHFIEDAMLKKLVRDFRGQGYVIGEWLYKMLMDSFTGNQAKRLYQLLYTTQNKMSKESRKLEPAVIIEEEVA